MYLPTSFISQFMSVQFSEHHPVVCLYTQFFYLFHLLHITYFICINKYKTPIYGNLCMSPSHLHIILNCSMYSIYVYMQILLQSSYVFEAYSNLFFPHMYNIIFYNNIFFLNICSVELLYTHTHTHHITYTQYLLSSPRQTRRHSIFLSVSCSPFHRFTFLKYMEHKYIVS